MKNIIVCDLDGTLCNIEHRLHHVQRVDDQTKLKRKPDWDAFFAGVKHDTVNEPVAEILYQFITTELGSWQYKIVFCSGRPERCRADTREWLRTHLEGWADWDDCDLYMRQDGDFRRDDIVKQEILDKHIKRNCVLFCLDDRQSVVDMWRRNGLTCLQVADGNF
jgi:hypothetical protein